MHHDPQEMAGNLNTSRLGVAGEPESFHVDPSRYRYIEGRQHCSCLYRVVSAKTKVTKTKTALRQETYNLSDLKHDLHCGFVELGESVSVS